MKAIEERFEDFILKNPVNKLYSIRPTLEGVISELIDVKYPKEKLKVKLLLKRNHLIKKLKLLKRNNFNSHSDLSTNYKKRLILESMLELIEKHENYVIQLDQLITTHNYDAIILLIYFLEKEFDNNYNYLKSLMKYVIMESKNMDQDYYENNYEDTRKEVDEFINTKIEQLKENKAKQKIK